jgi:transcriptional regulator with XRE-family HTH domain
VRKSEQRTKVAVLRSVIGLSAKDFARFIGKTIHTVKSLEAGRLKLSEALAEKISQKTGVAISWLLGDSGGPPVNDAGEPLTREHFESRAADLYARSMALMHIRPAARWLGMVMEELLKEAARTGRASLALYRVAEFLNEFAREFLPHQFHGSFDEFVRSYEQRLKKGAKSSGSKKSRP